MLKATLQLRLGQQLTMTPQLQQAIRLLQLPALDLQAHVRQALESNVMLESLDEVPDATGSFEVPVSEDAQAGALQAAGPLTAAEPVASEGEEPRVEIADEAWAEQSTGPAEMPWSGDSDRSQEFSDERGQTLQEHLLWQLELVRLKPRELAIGHTIIDAVNDDGYLTDSLEDIRQSLLPEISCEVADIEQVLAQVQSLDPPGVGARTVGECIALQLGQLDPETAGLALALTLAARHLDEIAAQQFALIKRHTRASDEDLEQALALLRSCHPRPGSVVNSGTAEYVVPDVFIRRSESGWIVEINPSTLPRIRVNQSYASLLGRSGDYANLRAQLQEARWLLRSLEIRNDTLLKVARCIVQRQAAFFERGEEAMQPMILRDVAEAVEMHESTISRVTTAKYMHTPRGVYEFRYFFSSQVAGEDGSATSSTAIRAKIRKLIAQEDAANPLSDGNIAELLSQEGIPVARRTVAKYREAMSIAPSNERKRAAGR
jgi:RNA polymerase sigma-54 factor